MAVCCWSLHCRDESANLARRRHRLARALPIRSCGVSGMPSRPPMGHAVEREDSGLRCCIGEKLPHGGAKCSRVQGSAAPGGTGPLLLCVEAAADGTERTKAFRHMGVSHSCDDAGCSQVQVQKPWSLSSNSLTMRAITT
eukprot:1348916-Lingulodinium_polyedra.AAC.1